jgi:hypothetical protein
MYNATTQKTSGLRNAILGDQAEENKMIRSLIKAFYLVFRVTPSPCNQYYGTVAGAFTHCIILERSPEAALTKAKFFILKDGWEDVRLTGAPSEVDEKSFLGKDTGEELYCRARKDGLAFAYVAWSSDGKSSAERLLTETFFSPALQERIRRDRKIRDTGRCLHFEGDIRCREYINAHSIQKSGLLSAISCNGHVYVLSADVGTLGKNKGFPGYVKKGIKHVSTFKGFCKSHDSELFAPIDRSDLEPSYKQVALYAYRSLCREYFVKENAIKALRDDLDDQSRQKVVRELLEGLVVGNEWGFSNLNVHKAKYEDSFRNECYDDFRYILFTFKGRPTIAFSSLIYPDYTFCGDQIQDLADHSQLLRLMTLCSAPMKEGWGFLLAWHRSSSDVCDRMIDSLKSVVRHGGVLSDYLFRMAISSSENLAISPAWLDGLPSADKEEILMKVTDAINIFQPINHNYLNEGLEGISGWTVDRILDGS